MINLELINDMVEQGYIMKKKHPELDLWLYDYSPKATYDKVWNEATLNCRGLVLDVEGNIVAKPFKKFFNYEELEGLENQNIPEGETFTVTEKMDGSLGIVYWYDKEWRVNTRGSFDSEQAVWAKKWFDANISDEFKKTRSVRGSTFLVEIIYPSNRIVVDYEGSEKLVLLSIMRNKEHDIKNYGQEVKYHFVKGMAIYMGFEVTTQHEFEKFEDMFKARELLTKNQEGFVVTFDNGFKFKLKGAEYCKLHRALFMMTPLSFWEMYDGRSLDFPKDFLEQFPEEFRERVDKLVLETIYNYGFYLGEIISKSVKTPYKFTKAPKELHKERYLYLSEHCKGYEGVLISWLDGKLDNVEKWIKTRSRPKNNIWPLEVPENVQLPFYAKTT